MLSMLSPIAPPAPAPGPGANATTRHDEQGQTNPGSFGEALARSLAPAKENSNKPVAKAVTPQLPRRATDPKKTDAADLANAMALSLLPLASRMEPKAVPASAGAGADAVVPEAPLATLASGNALLANAPALAGGAAATDAQAGPAPGSAASDEKSAAAFSLKADQTAASDDAGRQTKPLVTAMPAGASSAGLPGQSAKDDVKATRRLTLSGDDQAGVKPTARLDSDKVTASASSTPLETSSLTDADSALAATGATNAGTALSMSMTAGTGQAPGGVTGASTPATATTAALAAEVGSAEWGKALGQQVVHMTTAGHQVAELQLNPPGLGPLKVTLSLNDNQMQAMFVSAHAAVRTAVEQALPQLRATLAESGISLGNTSVGAESQQQTAFANQQSSQTNRSPYSPGARQESDSTEPLATGPTAWPAKKSSSSGIDTYA